ncbi:MAG: hypothetical protein RXR59_06745 [Sulfolobus sp.]
MKSSPILILSMLLLLIGIVLSLESIKTEYISLYNFGHGNVATPPPELAVLLLGCFKWRLT